MTDGIVARLPADAAARRLPEFIKTLRINRAARRESVYASDNVYALLDALDTVEARVRELEMKLVETRRLLATVRDDAMRLDNDFCFMEARAVAAESAVVKVGKVAATEAIERAARCAEGCDLPERDWMPGSLYDKIRLEVGAAIRGMRKEER